jgi:tetratricopeptide (TPR) repeat protein
MTPRPTPVRCAFADNVKLGMRAHFTSSLKTAIAQTRGELLYVPHADYAITVTVLADRIVAALPTRKATVTIHTSTADIESTAGRRATAATVICGVALLFASLGARGRAIDVLEPILPVPAVYFDPHISSRVSHLLMEAKRADLALRVVKESPSDIDPTGLMLYRIIVDKYFDTLRAEDKRGFIEFLAERAERAEKSGDHRESSLYHYSLSQTSRAQHDYATAISELEATARLDPRYRERPYFHKELAGSLWQVGRYGEAARSYEAALNLGGDTNELAHLYIDALFWAGHFERVVAEQERLGSNHRLAVLDAAAAGYVQEELGVSSQERRPPSEEADPPVTPEEARQILVEQDALDVPALITLANSLENPTGPMLVAALAQVSDGKTWALAAALGALSKVERPILEAMIQTGMHFERDSFLDSVNAASRLEGLEGNELTQLLDDIVTADSGLPSTPPDAFELRIHGSGGETESIHLY